MSHKIIFSISNALNKWLTLNLERIPSPDGKKIGIQPLITNSHTISWQCHVIKNSYNSDLHTVIAVEAYSRFTLLLPFPYTPSKEELEDIICHEWTNSIVDLAIKHGEISFEERPKHFMTITQQMINIEWWRNTDLSVNGHVSDAEQWIVQTIENNQTEALTIEQAQDLAFYINSFFKRAKDSQGKKQKFYPVPRFVDDNLARFISPNIMNNTTPPPKKTDRTSNVISMTDYLKSKALK